MARYSLSEIVTLRRAEEQTAAVLEPRMCVCGRPVKKGSVEELCMRCRQMARRRARRQREANRA
jgi:hypothetical protein